MMREQTKYLLQAMLTMTMLTILLTSCSTIKTMDNKVERDLKNPREKIDYKDALTAIERSISTFAIGKNGEISVIGPNFMVLNIEKFAVEPGKIITGREFVTFDTFSIFATKGSPIEIYSDLGFAIICYRLDDRTGEFLGACK